MTRRASYINTQLDSITSQLHELFDELGVPTSEQVEREKELYLVISEALNSHVQNVRQERDNLKSRCIEIQRNLGDMAKALKDVDVKGIELFLQENRIKPPYREVEKDLLKGSHALEKIYLERSEIANRLIGELNELGEKVDGMFIQDDLKPPTSKDDLDLSLHYLNRLQEEIKHWKNEFQNRVSRISLISSEIVTLWTELGTPQDQLDRSIITHYKTSPEKLGCKLADLSRLEKLRDSLSSEKEYREETLNKLKTEISALWSKMKIEAEHIQKFEFNNRGLGLHVITAYEEELKHLREEKLKHVNLFVLDAREQLKDLWEKLFFTEVEMYQFTPAWADIFTDASLESHESEIARLNAIYDKDKHLYSLIKQFQELLAEEKHLEASTQDASRLLQRGGTKRDPTRLLREEKTRKRIAKRKPILLQELQHKLTDWAELHDGKPFLVYGEPFITVIDAELEKRPSRKPLSQPKKPMPLTPRHRSPKKPIPSKATKMHTFNGAGPRTPRHNRYKLPDRSQTERRPRSALNTAFPTIPRLNITSSPSRSATSIGMYHTPESLLSSPPRAHKFVKLSMESEDSEFEDPGYMKWKQEALKKMEKNKRPDRVSILEWEKDTF